MVAWSRDRLGDDGGWLIAVCVSLVLAALIQWRLYENHRTWDVVLEIPGRLVVHDQAEPVRASIGYNAAPPFDVSPDGQRLLLGRLGYKVEEWDLRNMTKIRTISVPRNRASHPGDSDLGAVSYLSYLDGGRIIFGYEEWIYTVEGNGNPQQVEGIERHPNWWAVSPDGEQMAVAPHGSVNVHDLNGGEKHWKFDLPPVNGSHVLVWSADGGRLLLKDLSGLWLFDADHGELIWESPELDFRRPWPHFSDELSGFASQTKDLIPGMLPRDDSQYGGIRFATITADGRRCIAAYESDRSFSVLPSPSKKLRGLLRLYEVEDGEVLWEAPVEAGIRDLGITGGGSIIYVQTTANFTDSIDLFDVSNGARIGRRVIGDAYNRYNAKICFAPKGESFVAASNNTWIFGFDAEISPTRLLKGEYVAAVKWLGDDMVMTYGDDATTRIFKRIRPGSRYGLWVLWETWAVHGMFMASAACMVIYAGRRSQSELKRPLPWQLWAAVVTMAVIAGSGLAGDMIDYLTRGTYDTSYRPREGWALLFGSAATLLGWVSMYKLMRLARGWYRFMLILLAICATFTIGFSGWLAFSLWKNGMPALDSLRIYHHGWMPLVSLMTDGIMLAGGLCLMLGYWILLRSKSVAAVFSPQTAPPA